MSTQKPAKLPEWATGAGADITEPPSAKKQSGWAGGSTPDRPPAQFFNWLQNQYYQWLAYFASFMSAVFAISNAQLVTSAINISGLLCKHAAAGNRIMVWTGTNLYYSDNAGVTWTDVTPAYVGLNIYCVEHIAADRWVLCGFDDALSLATYETLNNGAAWTGRATWTDRFYRIKYFQGYFYGLGVGYGAARQVWRSADLDTWTSVLTPTADAFSGMATDGNVLVIVGHVGTAQVLYTFDGATWTDRSANLPGSNLKLNNVTYGNGRFVIAANANGGSYATACYSANGISWTQSAGDMPEAEDHTAWYGGGVFFLCEGLSASNTGHLFYSLDGGEIFKKVHSGQPTNNQPAQILWCDDRPVAAVKGSAHGYLLGLSLPA